MPNIAVILREETVRLACREIRRQTNGLRRVSTRHRRDIAEMKRRISDPLTRHLLVLASFFLMVNLSCQKMQTSVPELRTGAKPDEIAPEGFVSLFNGINLDGWTVKNPENQDWRVVEGVIDCDPHEGPGDRNLWTKKSYGDFEVLVDWRIKESPYINRAARIILPDGTYKKDDSGKEVLIEVPNTDSGVFLEHPLPLAEYLKALGKYRHLSEEQIAHIERSVGENSKFIRSLAAGAAA